MKKLKSIKDYEEMSISSSAMDKVNGGNWLHTLFYGTVYNHSSTCDEWSCQDYQTVATRDGEEVYNSTTTYQQDC